MSGLTYAELPNVLESTRLKKWAYLLRDQAQSQGLPTRDKRLFDWLDAIDHLPDVIPSNLALNESCVRIGQSSDLNADEHAQLDECLRALTPWRKGPFDFFGHHIDTEWRSDLKWNRLAPHISDLQGREVLDVGCGSGYHCWRMRAAGASVVVGIDPSLLFCAQFKAAQHYVRDFKVHVLPLKLDDMPMNMGAFQTVFSMGVLYHRRSPFDHLANLRDALQPSGELVLETLVVDGPLHHVLVPKDRYAQMRNVWCLPSILTLEHWLRRMGFKDVHCVDKNVTAFEEQRRTDWMSGHSLQDFLDPTNTNKTIEGYPAPQRAILIAKR